MPKQPTFIHRNGQPDDWANIKARLKWFTLVLIYRFDQFTAKHS